MLTDRRDRLSHTHLRWDPAPGGRARRSRNGQLPFGRLQRPLVRRLPVARGLARVASTATRHEQHVHHRALARATCAAADRRALDGGAHGQQEDENRAAPCARGARGVA